jgi:hypothetical protein
MKDILQDIINHTLNLSDIDLLKVCGSTTETVIHGKSEKNTVFLTGKFKNPVAEFDGIFGMPNLPKLKTILSFSEEYDDSARITVVKQTDSDGTEQPSTIHFENKSGDFVNDYRLMGKAIVESKVPNVLFKGNRWDTDFEPSVAGIQRLKKQSSLHSEDELFKTTLSAGNLTVHFGNPTNYSGRFVFQQGLSGTLSKTLGWPVKQFISIMDLLGDKHIYITDQGAMRITVDSGLALYEYLLPAHL